MRQTVGEEPSWSAYQPAAAATLLPPLGCRSMLGVEASLLLRGQNLRTIGVRAGKFLGYEIFLPELSQTCLKSLRANFCANIFSHTDHNLSGMTSEKGPHAILQKLGSTLKSNNVGRHFCPYFQ